MNVKDQIITSLKKALLELGIRDPEPKVENSALDQHGDYTTNIALILAKQLKSSPMGMAGKIVDLLNTKYSIPNTLGKSEAVKPGFINFWLSKNYILNNLQQVVNEKNNFGKGSLLQDKKVMVEFTDPNPFKEFHIGHLYSNAVGESLCRLLESQGAVVKRVNYQGDVGLHVAKAMFGILRIPRPRQAKRGGQNSQNQPLEERIKFLGQAYAAGAKAYEDSEDAKQQINQLNRKIYEKDPEILDVYQKGRQWSLDYFEKIYARLGTKFDYYYFESDAGKIGLDFVKENLDKGIFEKSEGAVIFPGKKYARLPDGQGLHKRVFINSLGLPTYEAKELGLAPTKYKDFPYDLSIIVTGNEIVEYFKVILKALSLINPDLASKTKHVSHGMVKLPSGKMSSRTGEVITGEWLLDEAKKRIMEKFKEMDEQTGEDVAVGAVKYALLRSSLGKDISFSFEQSISLEGDSGPYLQYTYARTQSVLTKAKTVNRLQTTVNAVDSRPSTVGIASEELALLRTLAHFAEVVEDAAHRFSPHILCQYLFTLAAQFNLFYQKHPILESEEERFRAALTSAVGQVLKNGLHLLGIKAPQRM